MKIHPGSLLGFFLLCDVGERGLCITPVSRRRRYCGLPGAVLRWSVMPSTMSGCQPSRSGGELKTGWRLTNTEGGPFGDYTPGGSFPAISAR